MYEKTEKRPKGADVKTRKKEAKDHPWPMLQNMRVWINWEITEDE